MDIDVVPAALAARLGHEATSGLLHVLDLAQTEWRDDVISVAADRFNRRLAEEGATLRVQIAQEGAALRQDMSQMEVRILREVGTNRFEVLKWSFVFWIGQVVTMSAVIAAMLRTIR